MQPGHLGWPVNETWAGWKESEKGKRWSYPDDTGKQQRNSPSVQEREPAVEVFTENSSISLKKKKMWKPLNIALVCPIFMRIKILSSWKDWHQEGTNEYSHWHWWIILQLSEPRDLSGRPRSQLYYLSDSFLIRSSFPFIRFHALFLSLPIYSFYVVNLTT